MSMRIADTKIGGGRTILRLRKGRDRAWPLPRLGSLAGRAARPSQAAAWEPALRHGDRRTPRGRLTGASEQNAPVSIRCCHGYMPEEYIHALYPYPLRIRAGDAYSKYTMRKRGEDISILSDKNCKIISDP